MHDTAQDTVVVADQLAHRNPISAYDGRSLSGAVTTTVLRGELLDRDDPAQRTGRLVVRPGARA